MKLKTLFSTYLIFLVAMFSCIAIIFFYVITNPMNLPDEYYLEFIQNMRNLLLLSSAMFSVFVGVGMYYVLRRIFRPLNDVVSIANKYSDEHELIAISKALGSMSTEIERELFQMKGIVDNFTQEIQAPLDLICDYADGLKDKESAENILDEAERIKKITNSLLTLATLQHYKPVIENIYIPQLFEDIHHELGQMLYERDVELLIHDEVDKIKGQGDLIKILLLNLCTNAIASCASGMGMVYLEAIQRKRETILIISDNGHGIPKESLSKLTDPFYRVNKARSREYGGVGLGMTLCKQIADIHEAKIVITSNVGSGTVVEVIFLSPEKS